MGKNKELQMSYTIVTACLVSYAAAVKIAA